jgi:hypothetical protein
MSIMIGENVKGKTLSDFPEILALWDLEKNGPSISLRKTNAPPRDVLAADVPAGCTKKVHWKCPHGPDHQWYYWIGHMTRRGEKATYKTNNCPFCSNSRPSVTNSVASLYPEAAAEWHPSKNGEMSAADCVSSSFTPRWWVCQNGHEYRKSAGQRCKMNRGCKKCMGPYSGRMVSDFPEKAKFWAHDRNDIGPEDCPAGRNTKYWWKCPEGDDHYWFTPPSQVIAADYGCSVCAGKTVTPSTSLATNYPDISREWHPTKNGKLTPDDFTWGSGKKVWWECSLGHEWDDSITHRTGSMKTGCPYCAGRRVSEMNNITNNSPELLATWDWEKNEMTPDEVAVSGYQDIAWLCNDCEHRWTTKPAWRRVTITLGNWRFTGCPNCSPSGFHTGESAHMYLLSIRNSDEDIIFYKLGITNRDPIAERIPEIEKSLAKVDRFSRVSIHVEELLAYNIGRDAKDLENTLKNVDEIRCHIGEKFTGSTELFLVNPLEYAREMGWLNS